MIISSSLGCTKYIPFGNLTWHIKNWWILVGVIQIMASTTYHMRFIWDHWPSSACDTNVQLQLSNLPVLWAYGCCDSLSYEQLSPSLDVINPWKFVVAPQPLKNPSPMVFCAFGNKSFKAPACLMAFKVAVHKYIYIYRICIFNHFHLIVRFPLFYFSISLVPPISSILALKHVVETTHKPKVNSNCANRPC